MALKGSAFMIMWHDITVQGDADYNLWHTRQHMPERLDHPGFRRSRRGINRGLDRQTYFTCYEGDSLATFASPEYLASLNGPTAWTQAVAPHFRNFLRMICVVLHSAGRGSGGGLVTARFDRPEGSDEAAFAQALAPLLDSLADHPAVTGVHLGAARPDVCSEATSETGLRPPMHERPFDLVLYVETIGLAESVPLVALIESGLAAQGARHAVVQPYAVAYTLERREAQ